MQNLQIYPNGQALAQAAAQLFVRLAAISLQEQSRFSAALSGGTTPLAMYARLAEIGHGLNWAQIQLFWSDERCVPPEQPESNYGQARPVLLERIPIPAANVHRMPGELPAEQAAGWYEREVRVFLGQARPPEQTHTFDLALLGLGEDGHTASLFPGSPALEETQRLVAAVAHRSPPEPLVDRVTLTLAAINRAAQVVFLVSGAQKAAILRRILANQGSEARLPAQRVQPQSGPARWLADAAAAGQWEAG